MKTEDLIKAYEEGQLAGESVATQRLTEKIETDRKKMIVWCETAYKRGYEDNKSSYKKIDIGFISFVFLLGLIIGVVVGFFAYSPL